MKRDLNLVREILLAVEASDADPYDMMELQIEGHTKCEIAYHVMMMHEAELITATDVSSIGTNHFHWKPRHIRWAGHEFLDAARNDSIWKKATNMVAEKTGGASLDLLIEVLTGMAKEQLRIGGQ